MSTFVQALVDSIDTRWSEVDTLIENANLAASSDEGLSNALCRSTVVFMAANLEGFMRDATKAVVNDVNRFSDFKSLPGTPKRTFCRTFIPEENSKDANARIEKLISLFDGLSPQLEWKSFLVIGKHGSQKNAAPSVIEKVLLNFGVKKVFSLLASSKIESVFKATLPEMFQLHDELREYLKSATAAFPYSVETSLFSLHEEGSTAKGTRTLWEDFIDDMLMRRNRIAHATTLDNEISPHELVEVKLKIIILQQALLLILCDAVVSGAR